ncbi:MAG: M15 family metallopeptidase [Candidatus Babeliales bacterium]
MFALGLFGTLATLFSWFTPAQEHTLVQVKQIIPNIVVDIKYATPDNFTGKVLYPSAECYLLQHVALALADVQKELNANGYGLKIWDGYRPLSVQKIMWNVVQGTPQEKYVANPAMGGKHTRGTAVDLTLVYLATGHEVEMPTLFDDLTERAWRSSTDCPYRCQVNRRYLENIMHAHGFVGLPHEWWHFDYQDWQDHKPLDINFLDLK